MQVREMVLSEIEAVIDLHLEGLKEEIDLLSSVFPGRSIDYGGRGQLNKLLTQVIQVGEGQIFVAVDGHSYAGYCLVTKKVYPVENPKFCGCINGIYVSDSYKRQGLGRELFEASLAWLKSEGVTYLELYHMINDERATAFWKKMGFMQIQLNCARRV